MIDITYEVGGRKVSPNQFGNELEKAILTEIADNVKKALGSVTCPDHGKSPNVTIKGRDINNLSWEVSGCCQKVIDLATKKLE